MILYFNTARGAQYVELLLGLEVFCRRDHAETQPQPHDGADDGDAAVPLAQLANEQAAHMDVVRPRRAQGNLFSILFAYLFTTDV